MRDKITYVVTDLSSADYQEYYNGFANRVLWPILHYRVDLAEFNRSDLTGYLRVNGLFADQLVEADRARRHHLGARLPPDPAGARIALSGAATTRSASSSTSPARRPTCCSRSRVRSRAWACSATTTSSASRPRTTGINYGRYLAMSKATVSRDGTAYAVDGRVTRIGAFPVGIETNGLRRPRPIGGGDSNFTRRRCATASTGGKLLIGVDRLDYSKGIIHRLEAFGHFPRDRTEGWRNRVTLLQITPKSREEIPEYGDMVRTVNELVGDVNGRYGEAAWTPLRYVNRSYSRTDLAGLFRMADGGPGHARCATA